MNTRERSPIQNRPRVIRVFVSSTFRDMQAERDELVKFIFPQLRKLCEQRGVTWGEVDLRWGITEEQKAEGKVLPICLEEIRRCRPYFIGVLGDRYGWIPDQIPDELVMAEPWLAEHLDHSVTELEILHGVLNNPGMAEHAYFYFREPGYCNKLPPEQKAAYIEDIIPQEVEQYGLMEAQRRVETRKQKLADLKERVRASGFPVHENYQDPREFGRFVLKDLIALVDRLFPEGSQPDPLDREAAEHEEFALIRQRVYVGRQAYFNQLNTFARLDTGPFVVLGQSGLGKSALLANWALQYRKEHPEELVVMHFIGSTDSSTDWAAMLRRIMGELKRRFNVQDEIPESSNALSSAFANWLNMAATRGRVVLVLDALNQLDDRDGARDLVWLPESNSRNVRMVVSTLPGQSLDELKKRDVSFLLIEPLQLEERRQLIKEYLALSSKVLDQDLAERIAISNQCQNPLFLRVLLDELRLYGAHEGLSDQIDLYLKATNTSALYKLILNRYEQDYEGERPGLVRDSLSLLWAARRGLSESELMELQGKERQPLPRAYWSPLFLALSDSLISRNGLIGFAHEFFRVAVRDTYLPADIQQQTAHQDLAEYFQQQQPGVRRTDELPWQLCQAKAWQELVEYLIKASMLATPATQTRFDQYAYWAEIEMNSPFRLVEVLKQFIETPTLLDHEAQSDLYILLRNTGHLDEALKVYERIERLGDVKLNLAAQQAWSLHLVGRSQEALALLERMENRSRELHNKEQLAISLGTQASILSKLGNDAKAIEIHRQAEKLYREIGFLEGISTSLANQAILLMGRGEFERALMLANEAERIERQLGNLNGLQSCLGISGQLHRNLGEVDTAIVHFLEQEKICRQTGQLDGLADSLSQRAETLLIEGKLEQALALSNEAETIWRSINRPAGLQHEIAIKANILIRKDDLDGAMALFREQEQICRSINIPSFLVPCLEAQGQIYEVHGEFDKALACFSEAEGIYRKTGSPFLHKILGDQGRIHLAKGDLEGAMSLFTEQEVVSRQANQAEGIASSVGFQGKVLLQQGFLKEALLQFEQAENLCTQIKDKTTIPKERQVWLQHAGMTLRKMGRYPDALAKFLAQEKACVEAWDMQQMSASLYEQGETLFCMGKSAKAMETLKRAEDLSRGIGDKRGLGKVLGNQAKIRLANADLDEAMHLFEEQEKYAREANETKGIARAIGSQGVVLHKRGLLDEAMLQFGKAEALCRKIKDDAELTTWLNNEGVLLNQQGQYTEALAKFIELQESCSYRDDKLGLSVALLGKANSLFLQRNFADALETLKKAEMTVRPTGDSPGLQNILLSKGTYLKKLGQLNKAEKTLQEHAMICRELGDFDKLQISLGMLSEIALSGGQVDVALALAKEQEKVCRQSNHQKGLADSLVAQGDVMLATGKIAEAKCLYIEAIQSSRAANDLTSLQNRLGSLGWVHFHSDEMEDAMECFEEQERISRDTGNQSGLERSLGGKGAVARAHGQREIAMQLFKQQEKICQEIGEMRDLQAALNNQALIYWDNNDYGHAMALFESIEQTCRSTGHFEVLWHSLYNQAEILFRHLSDRIAARKKVSEAVDILRQTGLEPVWLEKCQALYREIGD